MFSPVCFRPPDMATMHQDTSEDHELVREKLEEVFGVKFSLPNKQQNGIY